MTVKEIAFEIENLQIEAEKVNSFQNALFQLFMRGEMHRQLMNGLLLHLEITRFHLKTN